MSRLPISCPLLTITAALTLACGDDGNTSASAASTSQGPGTVTLTNGTTPTTGGSQTDSSGAPTGSGSQSGTGDSTTMAVDSTGSSSGGGPKFDLGVTPDAGQGGCGDGDGKPKFSYIWISNSPEGTVSKVNTFTGLEEGRYRAGPGVPDPSRTSVNLLGDAAVVDRNGGIMKVAAETKNCVDLNANGMIDTSSGPGNVLAWGSDECVLWHKPLPSNSNRGPRPVAWEGFYDPKTCTGTSDRVWVGHFDQSLDIGHFYRLDGKTGATLDMVDVSPWSGQSFGPYGGAVNKDGDFWVLGWNTGPLIRIDAETLQVDQWPTPPGAFVYGFGLDKNGDPWAAGSSQYHHFSVQTQTWQTFTSGSSMRGLQADIAGNIWIAEDFPCGVHQVDAATGNHLNLFQIPGCSQPVGISIDVEGFVWVVDQGANAAFKVDPVGPSLALTVGGLVGPYTYSDMTGAGLNLVVNPPG